MSFEEITSQKREPDLSRAASIAMVSRNGHRAYALVSISAAVGERLIAWERGGKAALQIGKGEDTGKIRIVAKEEGDCTLRAMRHPHTWQIILGCHSIFGSDPRPTVHTAARVIDVRTVEIDLPAFGAETAREDGPVLAAAAVQAAKEWADEARVGAAQNNAPARLPAAPRLPVPKAPAAVRAAPGVPKQASGGSVPHPPVASPPAASAPAVRKAVEREGVTLAPHPNAHLGHEHRGGLPLNERQALFLEPLVVALGSLIPTAAIIQRTGLRAEELTWCHCDLQPMVRTIGLKLEFHKPFYILKKE